MAMEPFIYREPAAGQQAVQYAQLQAQQNMESERRINDLFKGMSQQAKTMASDAQQAGISRSNMQQRMAEAEKDRALQRQGYTSAETIAGARNDQWNARLKAQTDADASANKAFALENFNRGSSFAEMLNNVSTPEPLKRKLMESGDVVMGSDGLWKSRYANPNPPVESIDSILQRRVLGVPGSMGVGGKLPPQMDSMPSRARMLQMGQPSVALPVGPVEPSPFETPGFKVFRQSDFVPTPPPAYDSSGNLFREPARPGDYNSNSEWRGPAVPGTYSGSDAMPIYSVPASEFLSTDAPPRIRLPGAYLPY